MRAIGWAAAATVGALACGPAAAQQSAADLLQRLPQANPDLINQEERERLQARSRQSAPPPGSGTVEVAPVPGVAPAPASAIRFRLTAVEFDRSEYLTRGELAALAAPLIGTEVTIDDLRALVAKVNALYARRGYATAQAVLPEQDVAGGVVRVRLVEGRIGQVSTEGGSKRGAARANRQAGIRGGTLADPNSLEQRLRRFNLNNDAQLRAKLAPGTDFGTTDVTLVVQEPPRISADAFLDNGGFRSTGTFQQGAVLRLYRLLGSADRLTGAYVHSRGVESGNGEYGIALAPRVRAAVSGSYGTTHILSGPLSDQNVRGASASVSGAVTALLYTRSRVSVSATATVQQIYSRTSIAGVRVIDNRAPSMQLGGAVTYSVAGLYASLIQAVAYSPVRERISETTVRPVVFRGSGFVSKAITPRLQAQFRADWQIATRRDLPGLLQYQIGGSRSSRAFSPGVAAGGRGFATGLDLSYAFSVGPVAVQPFVFVDHAQVSAQGYFARAESIGAGAAASVGSHFNLRLSYGAGIGREGLARNEHRLFFTAGVHI